MALFRLIWPTPNSNNLPERFTGTRVLSLRNRAHWFHISFVHSFTYHLSPFFPVHSSFALAIQVFFRILGRQRVRFTFVLEGLHLWRPYWGGEGVSKSLHFFVYFQYINFGQRGKGGGSKNHQILRTSYVYRPLPAAAAAPPPYNTIGFQDYFFLSSLSLPFLQFSTVFP